MSVDATTTAPVIVSLYDYVDATPRLLIENGVEHAIKSGLSLGKYADPIDPAQHDLTLEDARRVYRIDPGLLFVVM